MEGREGYLCTDTMNDNAQILRMVSDLEIRVSQMDQKVKESEQSGADVLELQVGGNSSDFNRPFKVSLSTNESGDAIVLCTGGERCVHDNTDELWKPVDGLTADLDALYVEDSVVYMTWKNTTSTVDGLWSDVKYGAPPDQDSTIQVFKIATTKATGTFYHHIGDIRAIDMKIGCS